MKYVIALISFVAFSRTQAQTSDIDIVNAILGQNQVNVNTTLEKLGVWYYFHFKDTEFQMTLKKFYSIENGDKHTKAWIIKYNKANIVDEITINFSHADRGHIEEDRRQRWRVAYWRTVNRYDFSLEEITPFSSTRHYT